MAKSDADQLMAAGLNRLFEAVRETARSITQEEIERAVSTMTAPEPAKPSAEPDKARQELASQDTSPGGVRVEWTEKAKREVLHGIRHTKLSIPELAESALPHLRVTVDEETLWQALEDWGGDIQHIKTFAARLGIHLEDPS
jgi:hypothetical protein